MLHRESEKNVYIGELFIRYLPLLYGVCLKYLKNAADAEDAVLQLIDNLLYKIAFYEIPSFRSWIYDAVCDHCVLLRHGQKLDISKVTGDKVVESERVKYLTEEVKNPERARLLTDCLKELPEHQRSCVVYFFKDKLSYSEIVNKTGYTLQDVKSYIQNGKRCLINFIEKND